MVDIDCYDTIQCNEDCDNCEILNLPELETQISLENGKYTFTISLEGQVSCLRFGKPWVVFDRGSKALISLIHKALE
ncbi:MAG: hypothetical protein IMZ43_09540 [Thermoplasmata archaeon]|nr:hypothetical protein [Thermoplasmata archaeon]